MRLAAYACVCFLTTIGGLGCHTQTSYHAGSEEGFSETRLSDDMFEVRFRASSHTQPQTVQDFVLLRAAELTQANGFKWFAILSRPRKRFPGDSGSVHYATSVPGVRRSPGRKAATFAIQCFTEKPQGIYALEAPFLEKSLKEKYKIE